MYAEGAKSLLLSYRLLGCVEFIDLRTLLYNLKVFFFFNKTKHGFADVPI